MQSKLKLLMVEDVATDAELIVRTLTKAGISPEVKRVETKAEFLLALEDLGPDIILSDYSMPQFGGMQALAIAHDKAPDTPFIFVSGTIGEEVAIESLKRGAVDYVLKSNLNRLVPSVERALQEVTARRARLSVERQLNDTRIRFELFMRYLPGAAYIKDWRGRYQFVNQAWEEIRNRKMADVVGRTDASLWPELAAQFENNEQLVIDRNEAMRSIETFPRPDGVHQYMVYKFPILDGRDRPQLVGGIAIDLTDRIQLETKLQERDAALSRAQQMAMLAHVVTDSYGVFESWSETLPQLAGLAPDKMPASAREWLDILHDDDRAIFRDKSSEAAATGRRVDVAYRLRRPDGTLVRIRQVIEPMHGQNEAGANMRWFNTLQDVTSQKNAEEKIARLNRVHATLSGINTLIVHARDRQRLFDEACRIAVEQGGFGIAWIGMFDAATEEITPAAWAGVDGKTIADRKRSTRGDTPQTRGMASRSIKEKKAMFTNNIASEPNIGGAGRKKALSRGYQSLISLPLIVDGNAVGNLALFAKEPDFFNGDELKLLNNLAGDISFALEHIGKEEKIARLSRVQEVTSGINSLMVRVRDRQELLNEACRIAVEHGKFGAAWIGEYDPATLKVSLAASAQAAGQFLARTHAISSIDVANGPGVVSHAMREKRPKFDNDIAASSARHSPRRQEAVREGLRSLIALPFMVDDQVVGHFSLYSTEKNFFNDDEVKLLAQLADNISFAWESIAREEKLAKLSRIRAISGEINAAIVRIHTREALLKEAGSIAAKAGKFELVWVATIDEESSEVRPVAWTGFSAEMAHGLDWAGMSAGSATLGEVIRTKNPAVRNDIETAGPGGVFRQEALKRGCHSTVCLPLLMDDKVVAVIILYAAGRNFFDADELALLNEVAADISFALQSIDRQEQLEYVSYYDVLTDLPNRTLFLDRLNQQLHARTAGPHIVALILINLERFRMVNETLGRNGGDELLRLVAQRLAGAFNGKDYLARVSADGFGMMVRDASDAAGVAHIVEHSILDCFREPYSVDGTQLRIAAKAGIALFPTDGDDADSLFKNAEAALKRTKVSSERYLFYAADMNARAAQALSMETRLRTAVEAQQFVLHYQPKIQFRDSQICGVEALIRWQDPEEPALVPPFKFIPILEETGMILEVGAWAIHKALADYDQWNAAGLKPPRVAVNVSQIQLRQKDFVEMVRRAVEESKARPNGLDLEITESLIMEDIENNIQKLKAVRDLGVNISIDDFGTGYSSLGYLARLPVNTLKIDRSFIITMVKDADSMTIVSTIISLAHSLKLKVIAEGVETEEQSRFLKLLKCDEMQGYLFSKPVPADRLVKILETRRIAGEPP